MVYVDIFAGNGQEYFRMYAIVEQGGKQYKVAEGDTINIELTAVEPDATEELRKTQFQIACMTLPYSQFPLERALKGIRSAFPSWGYGT